MFCDLLLGHTGERLQDHWSSGWLFYALDKKRIWTVAPIKVSFVN